MQWQASVWKQFYLYTCNLVTTIDIVSASQVRNPKQRGYIAGLRSHVYQMEELGLTLGLLFVFFLLISSVKIHRDLSHLSPLKQSIWHYCPCLRNGWVIQAVNQLRYQVVGRGEWLLSSRCQPARPQAGGCQCWHSGTGPAGLVTELCSVSCLPAPGTLCCRSWPSSSLGHWCAAGVQQKTSQSTPGAACSFLQIRIDTIRNLGWVESPRVI